MLFSPALPSRIEVKGVSLEYFRAGSGRPLLYLHGCDGVSAEDPFLPDLIRNFDVVALSLPGFGASDLPRWMRTTEDAARVVEDFAEALDLRDAVLVGSSFGGWVALEIATRGPRRFSSLVLADALGVRFGADPTVVEIRDLFICETAQHARYLFADPAAGRAAFQNMDMAAMDEDAVFRFCRNREALTLFGWAPTLHNPSLRSRLGDIALPTLVLWGAEDQVVASDYGRRLAEAIPGARFVAVAGAGHYLPIEKPAQFAEQVASFAKSALASVA